MKRWIILFIVLLAIPALIQAQSINVAKRQIAKYNYCEAIEILKKATLDEKTKNEAIPLLADCYRLQRDVFNSKIYYAKAIALPDAKPELFYYYALSLQATGEYAKAREMFLSYANKKPLDPKGMLFVSFCDSVLGPWRGLKSEIEIKIAPNINSEQSDFGPAFYLDELVFTSDRLTPEDTRLCGWTGRGYLDIMVAKPGPEGNFWDSLEMPSKFESKFNQKYHDGPATFTDDGKNIYFTQSFYGDAEREDGIKTNLLKIFYAKKSNNGWGSIKPFFLNSTEYSIGHPAISPNGQTLYFASDMNGGETGTDIWMCRRENDGWSPPLRLDSTVNTKANEMFPYVAADGELYFASEGHPGYGCMDIFKTHYENGHWTTPVNLQPPINGSFDDFAIVFAPGMKSGFFSSNRPGGIGSDDIYAFRSLEPPPPLLLPTYISGLVKDKTTLLPLADATVFLHNVTTGYVKILKTDTSGIFVADVDRPADYQVKAMKPNYLADCTTLPVKELNPGATITTPRALLLDKLVVNKTFRIENIYYDFDKYHIRDDAKPELDKLVRIMKENAITVELGSHTDCRGSFAYNDKLSQRRAESAINYIISAGIDLRRITAKGYGERQLTNKCADGVECTEAEHQANRRTEFKVIDLTPFETVPETDLGKFTGGEEIPAYSFAPAFFNICQQATQVNQAKERSENSMPKDTVTKLTNTEVINPDNSVVTEILPAANTDKVVFTVQLCSLGKEKSLQAPEFSSIDNVEVFEENGLFKYTSGVFETHAQALEYRSKMVKLGFTGAFVITVPRGNR